MEEQFVWVSTRRIRPDTLEDFEQAWRPAPYPEGLPRAYAPSRRRKASTKGERWPLAAGNGRCAGGCYRTGSAWARSHPFTHLVTFAHL
ncbi:hypothetical protein ACFY1U_48005 [Streptomyces sp. NPDC001351]|uniref:hypothetical protein n=1 Tax=Streptomyces sp. NPDC001351 TaxID=3364564 RepID=UPI00367EF906